MNRQQVRWIMTALIIGLVVGALLVFTFIKSLDYVKPATAGLKTDTLFCLEQKPEINGDPFGMDKKSMWKHYVKAKKVGVDGITYYSYSQRPNTPANMSNSEDYMMTGAHVVECNE